MENVNIIEQMVTDIKTFIEDENIDLNEIQTWDLYDKLFVSWVTGNDTYNFYPYITEQEAMQNVFTYKNEIKNALEEYCVEAKTIVDNLFNYKYFDSILRCYKLGEAIDVLYKQLNLETTY